MAAHNDDDEVWVDADPELDETFGFNDRPRGSRRRWRGFLWVFVLPATVAGLIVLVVALSGRGPAEPRPAEDQDRKFAEVRDAFNGEPVADDPEIAAIRALFERLGRAFQNADGAAVVREFDLNRTLDEMRRAGLTQRLPDRRKQQLVRGLRTGMQQSFTRDAALLAYERFDLKRVRFSADRQEALVFVRHWDAHGINTKYRWWLVRSGGDWRVYDFEDLSVCMRISTSMALVVNSLVDDPSRMQHIQRESQTLSDVAQALVSEDYEAAAQLLARVTPRYLPREMQCTFEFFHAIVHLNLERYTEALEACRRAEQIKPDMPGLQLVRVPALNGLERYAEALAAGREYLEQMGDDPDIYYELGQALEGLERSDEAAAMYRKGLDDHPDSIQNLWSLGLVLPEDQKGEIGERLARFRDPSEHIRLLGDLFIDWYDIPALAALARAYSKLRPDDPLAAYYDAYVSHQRGDHQAAADRLGPFLSHAAGDDENGRFLELYLSAMHSAGQSLAAYRRAVDAGCDARVVFDELAEWLSIYDEWQDLSSLLAIHRTQQAADPNVPFYEAALAEKRGEWEAAVQAFRQALAAAEDDPGGRYRLRLASALYYSGRWREAWETIEPQRETFQHLAELMLADGDTESALALLELHRAHDPDDAEVPYLTARVLSLNEDHDEAVVQFEHALARTTDEERRREIQWSYLDAAARSGQALRAYEQAPDPASAFQQLAGWLQRERQAGELRKLVERHRSAQPADAWLDFYEGEAAMLEERWDDAIAAFRSGSERGDEVTDSGYRYRLIDALAEAGRGVEALRIVDPPELALHQLAAHAQETDDLEALARITEAYRRQGGNDAEVAYYEARLATLRGQHAEAADRLRQVIGSVDDPTQRARLQSALVAALFRAGQPVEAWRTAPDRESALRQLGDLLFAERQFEEVDRLLAAAGDEQPASVWLEHIAGRLAEQRQEWDSAIAAYRRGLEALDEEDPSRWQFEHALLAARARAGQALEAYRDGDDPTARLSQLGHLLVEQRDGPQLEAIVGEHRSRRPDDVTLHYWDAEIACLQGDFARALAILDEHERVLRLSDVSWAATDKHIYALLKTGELDRALEEARRLARSDYDSTWWLALVHAARGDVSETARNLAELEDEGWTADAFYDDEILGPALRSDEFASLREKYPEPEPDAPEQP